MDSARKKDWVLTQDAFDAMLGRLDEHREQAAQKYESIRQKLTKLFKWRGCPAPEELTDRTIDRVARRLQEGTDLRATDPYLYFHGVALNVLREHWKNLNREGSFEGVPTSEGPFHDPIANWEVEAQQEQKEIKLECLDECLRKLSVEDRDLVRRYHHGQKHSKIEGRRLLAKSLKVPINALRIRAYRIRVGLEGCIDDCANGIAPK